MSKLIIHLGTGTILDADDGVVVLNTDLIANDDDFDIDDESSIIQMAELYGKPVNTNLPAEVSHANIVDFSPQALREEALALLDLDDHSVGTTMWEPHVLEALKFVAFMATDEELYIMSGIAVSDDDLWLTYRGVFIDASVIAHSMSDINKTTTKEEPF